MDSQAKDEPTVSAYDHPEAIGVPVIGGDTEEAKRQITLERAAARAYSKVLRARGDPNVFAEIAFKDAQTGRGFEQGQVHREFQNAAIDEDSPFLIFEMPRNHGKTNQMIVNALWQLGNNPELRIKIVCESDKKAIERLQVIQEHIEKNPVVRDVFPWLKPAHKGTWSKKNLMVDRKGIMPDSSIEACGIQTAATGGRADVIIADDPVGRRNTLELPKLRETIKRAWKSDWLQNLEPTTGRVLYICTPWHTADLTHELKSNPVYRNIRHPVSNNWESPWPEKWGEAELRDKCKLVGVQEYDRGFKLIALTGDIVVVPPEWIEYWAQTPTVGNLAVFTAYDLSTGAADGDFFAAVTVGLDTETGFVYVLEAQHDRLLFPEQVMDITRRAAAWRPMFIGIETEGYQASLPQFMENPKARMLLPSIVPMKTRGVPKALRLRAVSHLLSSKRVFFNPNLNPQKITDAEAYGDIVSELTQFPLAPHDDLVDALVYALQMVIEFGLEGLADSHGQFDVDASVEVLETGPSRGQIIEVQDAALAQWCKRSDR